MMTIIAQHSGKIHGGTSTRLGRKRRAESRSSDVVILQLLKKKGYAIGYSGKWHSSGDRDRAGPVDAKQDLLQFVFLTALSTALRVHA